MSDSFQNVTVIKKANFYFDGKVTSRTVIFPNGEKKTLGVMLPGDYEFGTELAENMDILQGELEVLLPGSTEWKKIVAGQNFDVPSNSKFKMKVLSLSDYCCTYLK